MSFTTNYLKNLMRKNVRKYSVNPQSKHLYSKFNFKLLERPVIDSKTECSFEHRDKLPSLTEEFQLLLKRWETFNRPYCSKIGKIRQCKFGQNSITPIKVKKVKKKKKV